MEVVHRYEHRSDMLCFSDSDSADRSLGYVDVYYWYDGGWSFEAGVSVPNRENLPKLLSRINEIRIVRCGIAGFHSAFFDFLLTNNCTMRIIQLGSVLAE